MTNIAFVDCETTHMDAEIGEAWEVAVILREQDDGQTTDTEYVWQIRPDLVSFDPQALEIGRFEERYKVPPYAGAAFTAHESGHITPMTRAEAITAIVNVLSGAVLVGSNPGFDDRFLRKLLGPGSAQWHYRPYDIVLLAAAKVGLQAAGLLPWSSRGLSRALGVEPPSDEAAHTALGDARWARDVYDAATKPRPAAAPPTPAVFRQAADAIERIQGYPRLVLPEEIVAELRRQADEAQAPEGSDTGLPPGFRSAVVIAVKCAVCAYEFDEDESYTVHFDTVAQAHQVLKDHGWTVIDDGRAVCDSDGPDHDELRGVSEARAREQSDQEHHQAEINAAINYALNEMP